MAEPTLASISPSASTASSSAVVLQLEVPTHLTVVIPCYNEAQRLPETLTRLVAYLAQQPYHSQVLIADDASTDETLAVAKTAWQQALQQHLNQEHQAAKLQLSWVRLAENQGKGAAVKAGVQAAQGEWVLLFDADGATPIETLEAWWEGVEAQTTKASNPASATIQPTIWVGQRNWAELGPRDWGRQWISQLFLTCISALVPGVQDTQCGFKLLRREHALALTRVQQVNGFAFDVEWLHAVQANGGQVLEQPVSWQDQPGSKVRLFRDGLATLRDLCTIALRARQGQYQLQPEAPPSCPIA